MARDETGGGSWPKVLKRLHPQSIPWPGSAIYNALSRTRIFQGQYQLIADDVGRFCRQGLILDIGTGPARLPILLCRQWPELQVVGLDLSSAMIRQARENLRQAGLSGRVELQESDAAELRFPDGLFDLVVSSGSLHHFKQPTSALNEVHRVLKCGASALIYDLVRELPPDIVMALRRQHGAVRTTLLRWHSLEEPFYSPAAMLKLAATSRFGTAETRFVGALCCLQLRKPA